MGLPIKCLAGLKCKAVKMVKVTVRFLSYLESLISRDSTLFYYSYIIITNLIEQQFFYLI